MLRKRNFVRNLPDASGRRLRLLIHGELITRARWSEETDIEEEWEYLVASFLEMKQFVGQVAQANLSMIV